MKGEGPIIKNVNANPTSASSPHGEDGSVSLQVDSGRLPHDLQTFHGDVRKHHTVPRPPNKASLLCSGVLRCMLHVR